LTTPAEFDQWLGSDIGEALALQRPLPDEALQIVARGDRMGDAPEGSLATLI
jgi:putative SOS response-associated peptidase YedK